MASCSFDHITVCSFLPLSGDFLPVGCIVSCKQLNRQFKDMMPCAEFYAHESGAQTPNTFAHMLEVCYIKPMREKWPDHASRLILCMDTGGGSLLYLNPLVAILCERHAVDVFVIPSYCTKAMCALDMTPHSTMSLMWSKFKAEYARQTGSDLSIFVALRALQHIVTAGLSKQNALAGWAHVGFVVGQAINRNKVLVDRFNECFQSKRAGGGLEDSPESKTSGVLDLVARVSPGCKALFSVAYKHCPDCGAENPKFEAEALTWFGPGKKPGWVKSSLAAKKLGLFVSGLFDSGAFKNNRTV